MPNTNHLQNETNILDPDDGISWLCTACNLPIFATPFSGGDGSGPLLHDQCADLPAVLHHCELHPKQPLHLKDNRNDETCSECSQKCGSKLYYCQDSGCGLVLDVACALPVKILHRSHHHRLVAVRGGKTNGICGVCGVSHTTAAAEAEGGSYFCSVCGFWVHPDCATSPNVIQHEEHVHPLVLYYDVGAAFGAQHSTPIDFNTYFSETHNFTAGAAPPPKNDDSRCIRCKICENDIGKRVGVFSCIKCRDSVFHIPCATSDRRRFKPVLSREARFPNLARLPLADEHQSIVREVMSKSDVVVHENSMVFSHSLTKGAGERHEFILKSDEEDDCRAVCDACLKIIDSPPFYSCSKCPSISIHDYCYRLPPFLSGNPAHTLDHKFLFALFEDVLLYTRGITCNHCSCPLVRACYTCLRCPELEGNLDVSCALMPDVVTHEAHGIAHFLRLSDSSRRSRGGLDCACCLQPLGALAYECRTCENFAIHTWCAMLPKIVAHKFDPHPLRLTTAACPADICEICERGIEEKVWRYGCESCDQSFHVDCIPSLDMNYKIKFLVSEGVQIRNVPKRLIRGLTLQGHGHGEEYCRDVADEYDDVWESN